MQRSFFYLSFLFLAVVLTSNCTRTKDVSKTKSVEETAAQILIKDKDFSKFETDSAPTDETQFIAISLERIIFMAGRQSQLDLVYNKTLKQWNGKYSTHQQAIKGSQTEKKENWEDLQPKTGWLNLAKALDENKIHFIRDAKSIDYEAKVADGEAYILSIRIGNKFRKYSMQNPAYFSNIYPEIKDFTYFTKIVDLLNDEFIADLAKS